MMHERSALPDTITENSLDALTHCTAESWPLRVPANSIPTLFFLTLEGSSQMMAAN